MKIALSFLFIFLGYLSQAKAETICYQIWKDSSKPSKVLDRLCMDSNIDPEMYVFEIRNLRRGGWETVAKLNLQQLRVIGCPACNYSLYGIKNENSAMKDSVQVEFRGTYNYQTKSEEGQVFVFGTEYNYHSLQR